MRLVTVFCPLTTTGVGEFVVQTTGEIKFVVDCKVYPMALVGHFRITFAPEKSRVAVGRVGRVSRLARAMYGDTFPPAVPK